MSVGAGPAVAAGPTTGDAAAGPSVPALDLVGVSAAYGPYRALFDVSFDVPAGGIVALIGSNGAGKSTVSRVVSGLLAVSAGTVRLDGTDVTNRPAFKVARAGMAHVVEGRGVFASLTVEENLKLAFRQRAGRRAVAESLDRAYDAFTLLGARRGQYGGTLSGGEQRILSLAKVLVVPPRVLVADEISLGLAPLMTDVVYDGLRRINEAGTALLIVEQQVDRVLEIAERAVVLEHGSVAYRGPSSGAMDAVEQLLGSREQAEADGGAEAADRVGDVPGSGAGPDGPAGGRGDT
jgi:branched-chain amino acid transport system ATP-binding protein